MIKKPVVEYPYSVARCHEMITKLSQAYDELKETYDHEFSVSVIPDLEDRALFGLTQQQARVLAALSKHGHATTSFLTRIALKDRETDAIRPENSVRVAILKIRNKITQYGATISSWYGTGYAIQNLELARENARKGIALGSYEPDVRRNPATKIAKTGKEVLAILERGGPMSVPNIVKELTVKWDAAQTSKEIAVRRWLQEQERQGFVRSAAEKTDNSWRKVWYICNKE